MRVVIKPSAQEEIAAAFDWYQLQRAGLGTNLTEAIERTLQRIAVHPAIFPNVETDVRQAPVAGFPYCIYYCVDAERILVISVFHNLRNPNDRPGLN